ncbi:MAG: PDZ domain-containing protein [Gammaproteobacteria bacterium]|nr:MAG: PDZ domain-containing protein [Gammaproteobacteria bacterium]
MKTPRIIKHIFSYIVVGLIAAILTILYLPNNKHPSPQAPAANSQTNIQSQPASNLMFGPVSYSDAVKKAAPAVVNIHTAKIVRQQNRFFSDPMFRWFFGIPNQSRQQQKLQTSLGSGVIIGTDGFLITNNHVIDGADEITAVLHDGRSAKAKVVGTDAETDIAVLKIKLPNLPSIAVGNSEQLEVGDVVLAIGNPFGVGQTVTQGIVSAKGRNDLGISTFENFIQTDAAINPGNSGGALINAHGKLIGINTAIFSKSGGSHGIGFAIPVNLAKMVKDSITDVGYVKRGWLGIEPQEITQRLAESFGLSSTDGVIIAGIYRSGPAAQAGLEPGDIILQIDNVKVTNASKAINYLAGIEPGKEVTIKGIKRGRSFTTNAKLMQRPSSIQ